MLTTATEIRPLDLDKLVAELELELGQLAGLVANRYDDYGPSVEVIQNKITERLTNLHKLTSQALGK